MSAGKILFAAIGESPASSDSARLIKAISDITNDNVDYLKSDIGKKPSEMCSQTIACYNLYRGDSEFCTRAEVEHLVRIINATKSRMVSKMEPAISLTGKKIADAAYYHK